MAAFVLPALVWPAERLGGHIDDQGAETAPGNPTYQQILAVFTTPGRPLLAKDICQALGVGTTANHTEWVYKTAYFKLMRMLDERSRENVGLGKCEPPTTADPANEWEAEETLRWLLCQLPTRQRAVLALAADGCENEEIFEILGIAISSVRSYRTTARRKLTVHGGECRHPGRPAAAKLRCPSHTCVRCSPDRRCRK